MLPDTTTAVGEHELDRPLIKVSNPADHTGSASAVLDQKWSPVLADQEWEGS